ncbi:MAG: glycosyl transferase family 90, partial [Acidobacteriota bacterium]
WARDFWLLHSNSVVLRQMSDFQSWFYPLIKENVHYIPVAGDLSDLRTVVLKAKQNDDMAKRISQNAQAFAASVLTEDGILGYTKELLIRYAELC